jgi:hypothetical protein
MKWEDPIVTEVHRIREQLAAEANYDLEVFIANLQKEQAQYGDRMVRLDINAEPTAEADRGRPAGNGNESPGTAPAA